MDLAKLSYQSAEWAVNDKFINSYLSYKSIASHSLTDLNKLCNCKFTVLIVDDNDFNLVIVQQLFKKI